MFPRRSTVQSSSVQRYCTQNPNVLSNQYQQQQTSLMHHVLPPTQPTNMVIIQNHQFGQQSRHFVQQNQQPVYALPVMNQPGTMHQYYQGGEIMPSAYVRSQNCTGAPAMLSVNNSGTTYNSDDDDFHLLIAQFRRARLQCLPEFHKWIKIIEQKFSQVQNVDERENYRKYNVLVQQMIKMLNTAENQLMLYDKQKIRQQLTAVIDFYNKLAKRFAACTNVTQNAQTNSVQMNQHAMLPFVTNGFAHHHTSIQHLNKKNDPEIPSPESLQSVTGPERRNIPIDSDPLPKSAVSQLPPKIPTGNNPSTNNNASSRKKSKKPSSSVLKKTSSAGNSFDLLLNLATLRSEKRSNSRKVSNNSTPSTPITPSSGNNGVAKIIKEAAINCQDQEKPIIGAAEETTVLGSPVVSGCTSLQPTQQHSEKQPIDRLLDAVKVASNETLFSAMKDMKSAIMEMDKLPNYAYLDHEHQQPTKRLKRDIETASRDVCYPHNQWRISLTVEN